MKKKKLDIGLGIKHPKNKCDSPKCPWHGNLKVRGRVFRGTVIKSRGMEATIEWNYYNYVKKYERYERKKTRVSAHNPLCINALKDDTVKIAECRPVSKTKKFVVVEKL